MKQIISPEKFDILIQSESRLIDVSHAFQGAKFAVDFRKKYELADRSIEISYMVQGEHPVLSVKASFVHQIGIKLFESFKQVIEDNKGIININQIPLPKIKSFVDREYDKWQNPKEIIESLCWVYKIGAKPEAEQVKWSFDGNQWYDFHGLFILGIEVTDTFYFDEHLVDDVVENAVFEPLEFSLYREGKMLISENPKGGFVLQVQSLEIAAKRFLFNSGDEQYSDIFHNRELPSIESLIVTNIFSVILKLTLTERARELITQIFNERNTIIHQGEFGPKKRKPEDPVIEHTFILSSLDEKLKLIRNILYYLAYRSGQKWVKLGFHYQANFIEH